MKRKALPLFSLLGLLLVLACCFTACDDEEEKPPSNIVKYQNLSLTGAKEVPANQSTSTGTLNGTYNKDTNVLEYNITWTGFTATNMHFHKASTTDANGNTVSPTTTSGGVAVGVPAPFTSPKTGSLTLTDTQETDLLAGVWYINIHSSQYPGGEIRAQMVP